MKARELKNSVLQMAVQGRLVPQCPEDEPASVLLQKIRTEKQKLAKAGKIKKEKQQGEIFKGEDGIYYEKNAQEIRDISEEIPFEIPENWTWARIGDIAFIYTGNSIPESVKKERYIGLSEGLNYIGTKDVGFDNRINYKNGVKIPFDEPNFRYAFPKDILMCIEGGSAGRKIAILNEKVCFGNKLCNFHQYLNSSHYLYFYLQSPAFISKFKENMTGIIGGVGTEKMSKILIPLPPLAEQKRIAAKIEELEPLIERYGQAEQELSVLDSSFPEQIRKSVLQYAVQGRLVPQCPEDEPASVLLQKIRTEKQKLAKAGKIKKEKQQSEIFKGEDGIYYEKTAQEIRDISEEIPFEIPDSWVWTRLGNIVNYGETPTVSYRQCTNQNLWILDLEDIEKDTSRLLCRIRIEDKQFKSTKKTFIKGDVLYSKLRPYLNKVLVADEDGVCTSEILPLRIYYGILPEYLKFCLKSPYFYDYVNALTYGIKMPRLGTKDGKRALIPLPPLAEQKRIAAKIDEIFRLINISHVM